MESHTSRPQEYPGEQNEVLCFLIFVIMILENSWYLISSFSYTSLFDVLQNVEHSSPDTPWSPRREEATVDAAITSRPPVANEPSQGGNSPVNILKCPPSGRTAPEQKRNDS